MEDLIPYEIIEKIIGYLENAVDLKACRLVSRNWNIISVKYFKIRHHSVRFNEDLKLHLFIKHMLPRSCLFSKFHFQLENLSTKNLQDFTVLAGSHVIEYSFELRTKQKDPRLHLLLQASEMINHSSHQLSRLRLNVTCPIPLNSNQVPSAISPLCNTLPCLQSLEICRDLVSVFDERLHILKTIKELAPYLQEIILSAWNSTPISRVSRVLEIFKDVRRIVLRNVAFHTYKAVDLQYLATANYRLTELKLSVKGSSEESLEMVDGIMQYPRWETVLYDWLKFHANSLKVLSIVAEGLSEIVIPNLYALNSLEIGFGSYYEEDIGLDPMPPFRPFLQTQFPNLRTVKLNFYSEDWKLFTKNDIFSTVETLVFQGYQEVQVENSWDIIFPCLKSLKLICLKVCQVKFFITRMTSLLKLKIQLSDFLTDEADCLLQQMFTGSDLADPAQSTITTASGNESLGVRNPSLANFKELKSLEIRGCGYKSLSAIVQMTKSGSLKPLQFLNIYTTCPYVISSEDEAILQLVHRKTSFKTVDQGPT